MWKTTIISLLILLNLASAAVAETNSLNIPALPEVVSNNGVAQVTTKSGDYLISFMGLGKEKDYKAVHNKVWALKLGDDNWQSKKAVPSSINPVGRLASTAIGVGQYAYVFGGYNVDAKHTEVSSPDVYRYNVETDTYKKLAPMPVPVDDSVALVYQNRYLYLVSGWHNDGNVNLVQIYDIKTNQWHQASPFLGQPVFGQAAAITGNAMLVCDGVAVQPNIGKRRSFVGVAQCLLGKIKPDNIEKIDWRVVEHPTKKSRYRMAATGVNNKIYFIGGSENPYNYDGMGYNGVASPASNAIWTFDVEKERWQISSSKTKTMDHRGLINIDNRLLTIGGMNNQQQVINSVVEHLNLNSH
jgi:N-acetylneuraminic acid mutarotase